MREPTPRSLTLDLLSSLGGESMPVGALVAAGRLFGISDGGMRVAVARLLAAGQIARDERGRYRMGPQAVAVNRRVRSWHKLEEHTCDWAGRWIGVQLGTAGRPRRQLMRGRNRALRLMGCELLSERLAIRPNNLRGGVPAVRDELRQLGLEPGALVFEMGELDPVGESQARSLWDTADLSEQYGRSRRDLAESEAQIPNLSVEEAMVESFLLGGRVIRELVLDPLLPEPLIPTRERRALVVATRRYDQLGRNIWAAFMASHGAPHVDAPANGSAGMDLH